MPKGNPHPKGTLGMTADKDWGKSPARKHRAIGMLRKLAQTAESERIRLQAIMLLLRIEGVPVPIPEITPPVKPSPASSVPTTPVTETAFEIPEETPASSDEMAQEDALRALSAILGEELADGTD